MPQVNLTFSQIEEALGRMAPGERIELFQKFDRELAMIRLDALVRNMRKKASERGITEDQITEVVEKVRHERYLAQKARRRR